MVSPAKVRRGAALTGLTVVAVGIVVAKGASGGSGHRLALTSPASAGGTTAPLGPSSTTPPTTAAPTRGPNVTSPSNTVSPSSSPATTALPVSTTTGTETLTGKQESTPYGDLEVRLTISGGRIINVATLEAPSGGRSGAIASYALPRLRSEVLSAQSANIDTVSGASYDSAAYAQSVQSALDQARKP